MKVPAFLSRVRGWHPRRVALIEAAAGLLLLLAVDHVWGQGDRFASLGLLHPFWIVVALVSVQYGLMEGVLAALLASVALLVGALPERLPQQDAFDYALAVAAQPLLWVAASLILGGVRERHKAERDRLRASLESVSGREAVLVDSYRAVCAAKERLERRIAADERTPLDMAGLLERSETMPSPQAALEALRLLLRARCASFYAWSDKGGLELEATLDQPGADACAPFYDRGHPLCRAIVAGKRTLQAGDPDDAAILAGEGLLATPVLHLETGDVWGMLKVEDIDFRDLTIASPVILQAVGQWAGARLWRDGMSESASGGVEKVLRDLQDLPDEAEPAALSRPGASVA